jgi:DNA helicase HerA-like ATPase
MIESVFKRLPLSMLLVGKRRSGKTNLLIKMLNSAYFINNFDKVFIFSPTIELDETWNSVRDYPTKRDLIKFDKFDESVIDDILQLQKTSDESSLIIIDDFAEKLKGKRGNVLEQLATKGRHFNTSFIFTSQKYNAVPTIIRNNVDEIIFFRVSNNLELKTIVDENDNKDLKNVGGFENLLLSNTKDYDYLLIVKGKEDKYYRGNKLDFVRLKISNLN